MAPAALRQPGGSVTGRTAGPVLFHRRSPLGRSRLLLIIPCRWARQYILCMFHRKRPGTEAGEAGAVVAAMRRECDR